MCLMGARGEKALEPFDPLSHPCLTNKNARPLSGWTSHDGTNNATEQIIGQRVKERYRARRGYKRDASILNVSRLRGWLGMKGHENELSVLGAN